MTPDDAHSDSSPLPTGAREVTAWEAPGLDQAPLASEALVVDVEGFAGPLDLLLALARTQKLDIARISIVDLVDQYLAFIDDARKLRLEVAADYLVMAAWLAFLKSRLLLPKDAQPVDDLCAEELARRLAFRLLRLDAMRTAAARLMARKRLGRDVFFRGCPETVETKRETRHTAEIYDLLRGYADLRRRTIKVGHVVKARKVWSIKDARRRLEVIIGEGIGNWLQLDLFIAHYLPDVARDASSDVPPGAETVPPDPRTLIASSFGATLEMVREGLIELRQEQPFGPIHLRRRGPATAASDNRALMEVRNGSA